MFYLREKDTILQKPFIFISYCHCDSAIVNQDIQCLLDMGVNLWYDVNMECGQDWTHQARSVIEHNNCVGVIFYNSATSFLSKPVQLERIWTRQKLRSTAGKDEDEIDETKDFFYAAVTIDCKTTGEMLRETYSLLGDLDAKTLENTLPLETVSLAVTMFRSEKIFIPRDAANTQSALTTIYNKARDRFATDDVKIMLEALAQNEILTRVGELYALRLGFYLDMKVNLDPYLFLNSNKIVRNGERYVEFNDSIYSMAPINWLFFTSDEKTLFFISEKILGCGCGDTTAFDDWLKTFSTIAFDSSIALKVSPRFMCLTEAEEMKKVLLKATSLPYIQPSPSYWWLSNDGQDEHMRKAVHAQMGSIYQNGFTKKNSILGYRPIIAVNFDELSKLTVNRRTK